MNDGRRKKTLTHHGAKVGVFPFGIRRRFMARLMFYICLLYILVDNESRRRLWIGREAVGNRFYSSIEVSSSSYIILQAHSVYNMRASQCTRETAAHCAYTPSSAYFLCAAASFAGCIEVCCCCWWRCCTLRTPWAPKRPENFGTCFRNFGAEENRVRPRAPTRRCEWLAISASCVQRRARKQNGNKEKIKNYKKLFYIMLYTKLRWLIL